MPHRIFPVPELRLTPTYFPATPESRRTPPSYIANAGVRAYSGIHVIRTLVLRRTPLLRKSDPGAAVYSGVRHDLTDPGVAVYSGVLI